MIDPQAGKGIILFSAVIIATVSHFINKKRRFNKLNKEILNGQTIHNKFYAKENIIAQYFSEPKLNVNRKRLSILFLVIAIIAYLSLYVGTKSMVIVYTLSVPLCLVIFFVVYVIKYESFYYERLRKIKLIIGNEDKFIEVRDNGLYFNIVFLEPYSYKKAIENKEANIFIPWEDIKSIEESSPPAFGGRVAKGRTYGAYTEMARKCLFIKLKLQQPSAKKIGRQIFLSLNLIDNYLNMEFLIKQTAKNMVKCRL